MLAFVETDSAMASPNEGMFVPKNGISLEAIMFEVFFRTRSYPAKPNNLQGSRRNPPNPPAHAAREQATERGLADSMAPCVTKGHVARDLGTDIGERTDDTAGNDAPC
jgi:hypothetical protein